MTADKQFVPTFKNVHRDIERYIEHSGKAEKRKDGFLVYHGYFAAQQLVVDQYLDERAYEPLVRHFRSWNWEVGDNDFLLDLTARLKRDGEWSLLETLWGSVISKRKKLYAEMRRLRKSDPELIPLDQFGEARGLLASSLERLRDLAVALGHAEEAEVLNRRIAALGED